MQIAPYKSMTIIKNTNAEVQSACGHRIFVPSSSTVTRGNKQHCVTISAEECIRCLRRAGVIK